MQTNIKLHPEDFLLVHKLLSGFSLIDEYEDSTLETLTKQGVGYFYVRGDGSGASGWDRVNRRSNTRTDIDLTNVAIPEHHTMILDGEEVKVSTEAYNRIKEFISCE